MPRKEVYQSNPDKYKKENESYYSKNQETIKPRNKQNSRRYRKENPDRVLNSNRMYLYKEYGLTIEQVNQKLINQNHKCIICGNDELEKKLHLDHDHITGQIRDFLCHRCNALILGGSGESIDQDKAIKILESAILYIKKWKRDTPSH